MAIEKVLIWKDGKWRRLFYQRLVITSPLAISEWVKLALPIDGLSLEIRNENAANNLDVSFQDDPRTANDVSFFRLAQLGSFGSSRFFDFVPQQCWVRQNVANHTFYWEVTDELGDEEVK